MTIEEMNNLFYGDGAPDDRNFGLKSLLTDEQLAEIRNGLCWEDDEL